jgi:hypothetical protein
MIPTRSTSVLALTLALFLSACDRPEPVTYQIPKEERTATVLNQAPQAASPPVADSSKMEVLPGMAEAAEEAPELTYTVPDSWEEFPPQSVRKANFRVADENGTAEIAVTVFPGDVGGQLANVNRWRSQIGLDPVDVEGMQQVVRPFTISQHNGALVTLEGATDSILGGILSFHGSTWFFKMQGAKGTVSSQAEAMEAFLGSVAIADQYH